MYTRGPWKACNDGRCSCKQVWSLTDDHPVAEVISGEWGDDYPAIRLTDDQGISGTRAEAYMERIAYGSVKEECAVANARLIAAAPELLEACIAAYLHLGKLTLVNSDAFDKCDAAIRKARGE